MSLIDVIFKKNALPKVPASLKELVGEIRGIKTAIADLWRSMTNAEGNINRLDEAVEADENTLGDITKHKVYLTGSALNQSMMPLDTGQNTIYVVKDDLTLSEDITIPANCVLEFEGGSIGGNRTFTFNNTEITGTLGGLNITPAGTIKGIVNLGYWNIVADDNSYDNAPIIEKVLNVFKDVYIPSGNFYVSSQIHIENISTFISDATFYYNGNVDDFVFVFDYAMDANIKFNKLINNNSATSLGSGIKFISTYNSNINITSIYWFKKGLEFTTSSSGAHFNGSAYNTVHFNVIKECQYGLRLVTSSIANAWMSEFAFFGGRIEQATSYAGKGDYDVTEDNAYSIYIENLANGRANSISFNSICIEGNHPKVYANKAAYLYFYNCRDEYSGKLIFKNCTECFVGLSYGSGTSKIDLSNNMYTGVDISSMLQEMGRIELNTSTFTEIDVTNVVAFKVLLPASNVFRYNYLEDTEGIIEDQSTYPILGYNGNYSSNMFTSYCREIIKKPDGITKMSFKGVATTPNSPNIPSVIILYRERIQ